MGSIIKVNEYKDFNNNAIMTSDGAGNVTVNAVGLKNTPAFRVTMGSNQDFSNNTNTKINFDTVDFDTDSAYDTTNKRFVCPSGKAGKYVFISGAGFFLDDGKRVAFQFKKNNSPIYNSTVQVENASSSSLTLIRTTAIITLAATDYVEAFAEQENGDTKTMRSQDTDFNGYKLIGA